MRPSDGRASLLLPINRRKSLKDDRAQGFEFTKALVDPRNVSEDLSHVREILRDAYANCNQEDQSFLQLLPLVPWLSDDLIRKVADQFFDYREDRPVSCSNLGELDPSIGEIGGPMANCVLTRGVDTHVSLADMQRTHGHLVVVASRLMGKITLCIESYQLSAVNTRASLAIDVLNVLGSFGLDAHLES